MKRNIFYLAAILISMWTLISCEKSTLQTTTPKIVLHKKAAKVIEADQTFGFELFREVVSQSEAENIMISPLSVSYALGMAYNGASGSTLRAFNDVLHFEDLTSLEVNESYKDLINQLLQLDKKVEFSIANSIWYKQGFQVLSEFIATNQEYFDASVREIDFSDPKTVEVINRWIEDKTNDKIQDMLDQIPGNAVMYLINAIYFNAQWKYEFNKPESYQGDFSLSDGTNYKARYMRVTGNFQYTLNEDFTAVELPYGDSTFSMVVMLPSPEKRVSDLVSNLDDAHWNSWFSDSRFTKVQIDLPKFKYGFKELLNDPLMNLGLNVAFTDQADFTRINPAGNLYISRVIHQTFIDVREEGTEAAAATIVELREFNASEDPPIYFKADKPFLYLIKENSTGTIVFIGKVGKPEYTED